MAEIIDLCNAKSNRSTEAGAAIVVDDARQDMDVSPNFCLQHLAMQNAAVNMDTVNGSIEGMHYEGVHTNGDGVWVACSLR